jgi:hypothetical protein
LSDPQSLTILGAILALLLLLLAVRRLRRGRLPYQRRGPLCSPAELRFLRALERAVGDSARIYAKVRLADLVEVRERASGRRFWQAFNAIACKHVDYVLCEPETLEVICVIELDDRSHQRDDRRERDEFVDNVMQASRIPMLRFPAQTRYQTAEVRRCLENTLK